MAKKIEELDKNFSISSAAKDVDANYFDVREEPFSVYGLYDYKNQSEFKRLPDEIAKNTNDGVAHLYLCTAGGRVRFSTDSPYILIKAKLGHIGRMPHIPLVSSAGFDLYIDNPLDNTSRYYRSFVPPYNMENGYISIIKFSSEKKKRYITINFPSYSGVCELFVGIAPDATLGKGMKYRDSLPVVYYGSSITQGGCASRPGNSYQNIISRRTNTDYINLGFSGSGKGEDIIAEYMATIPMSAFVSDYDHNAPTPEHLEATHLKLYKTIRKSNPDLPYIMISRYDFDSEYDKNIIRRNIIADTYRYARSIGDKNVYFIDGAGIFRGPYEDMCTVDGCHPNDIGFALLADAIGAELKRAFSQNLF